MESHPDDHAPFDAWLLESTDARLALVRLLAAAHAEGERLIDLIVAATGGDEPETAPTKRKVRARKASKQAVLF